MEVVQVLHMNGGVGESSYAQNSFLQKKAISLVKPVREEAIYKIHRLFPEAKCLAIADLGCSSGPNTFLVIQELIVAIHNIQRELGNQLPVDFQIFLNDLPGNDFNTIFRSLPNFQKQLKTEIGEGFGGHCFIHGVPGSFYDRLFQPQSLHFVHSSYSLHFLSQVPKGIGRSNKANIYLSSSSPADVIKAYYQQFQTDFTTFLQHRSEELVPGGCMVLTLLGRKTEDPTSKEGGYIWELLGLELNQMVSEGLIEEEKLDLFNIPKYTPSPTEIEKEVNKEGSFIINSLETSEVDWDSAAHAVNSKSGREMHIGVLQCMIAVAESMLTDHFGEGLMEEVCRRYGEILSDRMAKERTFLVNVTVSLTKN